jgi:hypothetical protein
LTVHLWPLDDTEVFWQLQVFYCHYLYISNARCLLQGLVLMLWDVREPGLFGVKIYMSERDMARAAHGEWP